MKVARLVAHLYFAQAAATLKALWQYYLRLASVQTIGRTTAYPFIWDTKLWIWSLIDRVGGVPALNQKNRLAAQIDLIGSAEYRELRKYSTVSVCLFFCAVPFLLQINHKTVTGSAGKSFEVYSSQTSFILFLVTGRLILLIKSVATYKYISEFWLWN